MAKITFPTSKTIACPLLIDRQHLESLDAVIDSHLPQMDEYKEKRISESVARRVREYVLNDVIKEEAVAAYEAKYRKQLLNDYDYRESRSVSLYLTKGPEIRAKRFSEAISQPIGEEEMPIGSS